MKLIYNISKTSFYSKENNSEIVIQQMQLSVELVTYE